MRSQSEYKVLGEYQIIPRSDLQFSSVYFVRLNLLRVVIATKLEKTSIPIAKRVLDLEQGVKTWIVGVIYRDMAGKPDIVQDISVIYHGNTPVVPKKYTGDDDRLFLEDQHGRIELRCDPQKTPLLVTGCVVGVAGVELSDGIFAVSDIEFPGLAPQPSLSDVGLRCGKKIAIVSGLLLSDKYSESASLMMLAHFLSGQLGLAEDAHCITRLVVAGCSVAEPPSYTVGTRLVTPATETCVIDELALYLRSFALSLPVHLMPGASDPTQHALPQVPFHKGLMRENRDLMSQGALLLESNPFFASFDGVNILTTAGQPTSDLMHYTTKMNEVDLLHETLKWRHIAPTAPDTLWTYPFTDTDPFVLQETPHVYVAGNQSEFSTKLVDGVRLITVPEFSSSGELVILDLETLEADTIKFQID